MSMRMPRNTATPAALRALQHEAKPIADLPRNVQPPPVREPLSQFRQGMRLGRKLRPSEPASWVNQGRPLASPMAQGSLHPMTRTSAWGFTLEENTRVTRFSPRPGT